MLVRAGFNVYTVFQANVRRQQNFFTAVDRISDVVEAPLGARVIAGVGEIVALVSTGHPHRSFGAIIQHDLLGQTKAQVFLEELAVGFDVDSEAIPVIETAHVDTARRKSLSLVLERWPLFRRRLIPLRIVIKLDLMSIGVLAEKRRAVR